MVSPFSNLEYWNDIGTILRSIPRRREGAAIA